MPTDTLRIKERLTANGNFTKEQADDIIEALFRGEDEIVTRPVLREELELFEEKMNVRFEEMNARFEEMNARFEEVNGRFGRWALGIVVANGTVTAVLLALFSFAS